MLGFSKKSRGQLMRSELGESWDHFLAAATHAANGVGQKMGPGATRVKGAASRGWGSTSAAFAPLAAAYREGAADATAAALKLRKGSKARKKGSSVSNKKTGLLLGLLAGGVAIGVASALVMRRRKQQWSEYDPTASLDTMSSDARNMVDKTVDKAADKGNSTMDKLTHHTSKAMDKTADKLHSAASSMRSGKNELKPKLDEAAERANDATDNMASKFGGSHPNNSRP